MPRQTFVLTGYYAGKTVQLGDLAKRYPFVNGKMIVEDSQDVIEKVGRYVGRCWEAFPEGSAELAEAQERDRARANEAGAAKQRNVSSGTRPNGPRPSAQDSVVGGDDADSASDSQGSETSGSGHERPKTVKDALGRLDPNNDAHWTKGGNPVVSVVAEMLQDESIGRKDIEEALPNFNREVARQG